MHRLARYDVTRRFTRSSAQLASQLVFGTACAFLMIILRSVLDVWFPTAGPFALVYPAILLATLYGHWQAGAVTYVLSFLWAWYFVLPVTGSFTFEIKADLYRVVINAASTLVVLIFAESFRRAVVEAMAQRDDEIHRGEFLMTELEHRTKNNFALVGSLLELQKRDQADPAVSAALDQAIARIHSFAGAYANLADGKEAGSMVAMRPYLSDVVDNVSNGAFHDGIEVSVSCAALELSSEVAVAIGLFTNEALTNCAKHAFPDGRGGKVSVKLLSKDDDWMLEISDDGLGNISKVSGSSSSKIGTKLMEAFARQAGAKLQLAATNPGRTLRLTGSRN